MVSYVSIDWKFFLSLSIYAKYNFEITMMTAGSWVDKYKNKVDKKTLF